MKILLDTNILIDYLTIREPLFDEADQIVQLCTDEKLEGYVAAHAITDLFYILRKSGAETRRKRLKWVCTVFTVIGIDKDKLMKVFDNEDFNDIEDCLQEICAEEYHLDYIVTRNVKDFKGGSVPAVPPGNSWLR